MQMSRCLLTLRETFCARAFALGSFWASIFFLFFPRRGRRPFSSSFYIQSKRSSKHTSAACSFESAGGGVSSVPHNQREAVNIVSEEQNSHTLTLCASHSLAKVHFSNLPGYPSLRRDPLIIRSSLQGTHFIELCCQRNIPLIFLQNITGQWGQRGQASSPPSLDLTDRLCGS